MYFLATTLAGLRTLRASSRAEGAQAIRRPVRLGWAGRLGPRLPAAHEPRPREPVVRPASDYTVYFLVPCLDEELVVEATVRGLLADKRARVIVIDDASADRTGELAAAVDPHRVILVRRELPSARDGKGPALNAGYSRMLADAAERGLDDSQIIVGVMDADGRLSAGALHQVLALFGDPAVGGVQLPVRIRNRHGLLALMQDVEFWGVSALAQFGRVGSGTVSLGGNGQFTRLRAIRSLDRDPWQVSLTEDLDLTLALAAKGWRLTTTPQAYVSQQGLTRLRPLINQRTRWFQGHLAAARWLPELWSSRRLSHLGMLELSIYVMVPWMLVLPWSVLFNYGMFAFVGGLAMGGNVNGLGQGAGQQAVTLALWYVMSFGPN